MTRGLGYLRDTPDPRDLKLGVKLAQLSGRLRAPLPPLPPSASVEHPSVLPKDQAYTSSCTGQAIAQAIRLAYLHKGVECPELSALDVYFRGRAEFGGQNDDAGSYLRTGLKAVIRGGIAEESSWPFETEAVNRTPNMLARKSAADRRGVRGYFRIEEGDVDGVRRAIASGYPVVAGWWIDQGFIDWNGQGVISGQIMPVGGHAMAIVSYAADGTFRLLNSWGSSWSTHGGYAIVDSMFVAAATDIWACEVLP